MHLPQPATAPDEPRWCVDAAVLHRLACVGQFEILRAATSGSAKGWSVMNFMLRESESAVDRTSDINGCSAMGHSTKSLRSSPRRGSKSRDAGSRLRG